MGISLRAGLLCEVVPEQSAEPQRCVREDPSGQLPQSLSVQHWDVSCQAVTQQGYVTLLSHILHPPGDNTEWLFHCYDFTFERVQLQKWLPVTIRQHYTYI